MEEGGHQLLELQIEKPRETINKGNMKEPSKSSMLVLTVFIVVNLFLTLACVQTVRIVKHDCLVYAVVMISYHTFS